MNSVAVSPDGKLVVSGSSDNTIRIWDLQTGQAVATPAGHSNSVADRRSRIRMTGTMSGDQRETVKTRASLVQGLQAGVSTQETAPLGPTGAQTCGRVARRDRRVACATRRRHVAHGHD